MDSLDDGGEEAQAPFRFEIEQGEREKAASLPARLRFLRRDGEYADAPRPGLILLDLNLPRRDGLDVLAELKADPELLVIPVVVLTTSQAREDILRSYSLHSNAFITKPVDFDNFIGVVRQIDDFFLTLVKLPD